MNAWPGVLHPNHPALAIIVAAIAPVAIRAINPADKAFGILPDAKDVEKALKAAKAPVKKAAKKAVAKKAAPKK